jgi:hypothetical protein
VSLGPLTGLLYLTPGRTNYLGITVLTTVTTSGHGTDDEDAVGGISPRELWMSDASPNGSIWVASSPIGGLGRIDRRARVRERLPGSTSNVPNPAGLGAPSGRRRWVCRRDVNRFLTRLAWGLVDEFLVRAQSYV